MLEIILVIILLITGLVSHFISAEVKKRLMDKGNWIAIVFSVISFFVSAGIIGFLLSYALLFVAAMCSGI